MEEIKTRINSCLQVSKEITITAKDVNKKSHLRKETTTQSIAKLNSLISRNEKMTTNFEQVLQNLQSSQKAIQGNYDGISTNSEVLNSIISKLKNVSGDLSQMEQEIEKLTDLVDVIKGDTNNIFSLALNASIVSSKYSNTSGVFDILANKLNEMSNFINQNLETIVNVVSPITEGVQKLIKATETVLHEITEGSKSYDELTEILNKQNSSIRDLFERAELSGHKIKEQKKMLLEVNEMVIQMDSDAQSAIHGSSSVADLAQTLQEEISRFLAVQNYNVDFKDRISAVKEKALVIWQTAENVNSKSQNQLEFSKNSQNFNDKIISESSELDKTAELLNNQTADNNKVSADISDNLGRLTAQLREIENNMTDSGRTIQKFNDDYKQIDNILEFLKNILKSMHLIGMYSRIESARDTEEFAGFMNISANITSLQKEIQNNIPVIEKNITDTHHLIDSVTASFKQISDDFVIISASSTKIVTHIEEIVTLNTATESTTKSMLTNSREVNTLLEELGGNLSTLTEIVKFPIEGSALNIKRGQELERVFDEMLNIISREDSETSTSSEAETAVEV